VAMARQQVALSVPPRGMRTIVSDAVLDRFLDITYSYRFGPPQHDIVVATLRDDAERVLSEAVYFVQPREPAYLAAPQLEAEARPIDGGAYQVSLHCDHFLHSAALSARGYLPDDNYFHLPPGRTKLVTFAALAGAAKFRPSLEALNLRNPIALKAP
jgi:beta-mannosidase